MAVKTKLKRTAVIRATGLRIEQTVQGCDASKAL
jgi:hypothetical protein